uniref:NADH dehydrogenase subunit 6 n=1 Tax=Thyasira tokunagai TaxID=3055801 RepID=A0AB39CC34_9BIVA
MLEAFFFFFFLLGLLSRGMSHPFSFGAMLLFVSIFFGGGISILAVSWYGFVLFLIFVGGLLVLFSYTCALAPKVKLQVEKKSMGLKTIFYLSIFFLFIFVLGGLNTLLGPTSVQGLGSSMSSSSGVLVPSFVWDVSIVWLVLILFLVMILVAYICKTQSFPLRAFSKKL